ncbi:MAG TPA: trypsin-like peptidase domain-containing protein [Drouetiella sp.]
MTSENAPRPTGISAQKAIGIGVLTAVIFSGGFTLGFLYSTNNSQKAAPQTQVAETNAAPLSASVATMASAADSSVVSIFLSPGKPQSGAKPQPFQGPAQRMIERRATGAGFIIAPDGYILTSSHVLRPDFDVRVELSDKRQFNAKVIGKDPFMDIAVIKIDATGLPVAKQGSSDHLRVGDWAIAIGSPYGFEHSVSLGIISGVKRAVPELNNVEMIQTDAPLNPGNSGGPLLNAKGEVIGINTAMGKLAQSLSFAIPIDQAEAIAKEIREHGNIARPYLGLKMMDIDADTAKNMGYPAATSVIVSYVVPQSPCEKGGLEKNDLIEKVDNVAVSAQQDVRKIIQQKKPDDAVVFSIARKDGHEERKVKLGTYPESIAY